VTSTLSAGFVGVLRDAEARQEKTCLRDGLKRSASAPVAAIVTEWANKKRIRGEMARRQRMVRPELRHAAREKSYCPCAKNTQSGD